MYTGSVVQGSRKYLSSEMWLASIIVTRWKYVRCGFQRGSFRAETLPKGAPGVTGESMSPRTPHFVVRALRCLNHC